ncbi:hypothetical protein BRD15_06525 [Halobacteriales archaeon SW_6_65_15]|jgi:hypothetical protein|nr:MAG: hypothetical protein BRD15_06525 [Halobacteriales archaeon SW_6_65_15]
MAASDVPSLGLRHPTADPCPDEAGANGGSGNCECNDCDYTVEIADGLPPKCPNCGGALTRVGP